MDDIVNKYIQTFQDTTQTHDLPADIKNKNFLTKIKKINVYQSSIKKIKLLMISFSLVLLILQRILKNLYVLIILYLKNWLQIF